MDIFGPKITRAAMAPFERLDRRWSALKYHKTQGDEARAKYANLVSRDPSRALSQATLREIREYARDTFGSTYYAPWLVTYAAFSRAFRPGCIPDNYVGVYMLKHVVGDWRQKLGRIHQRRVFQSELFPEILRCEDGKLIFPNEEVVPTVKLPEIIFERSDRAFLKLSDTKQSVGVSVLKREDFDQSMLPLETDFVIQHALEHDPEFDRFCPGAATTIRVTTVMTPDGAQTREVRLRFGRAQEEFIRARTNVILTVDRDTGAYFPEAAFPDWTLVDRHPDTGEVFAGNTLPHLKPMKQCCEELHEKVPGVGWLGWDICPMAGGSIGIMEVNAGHSDIKFGEAMHGPNYADMGWENLHRQYPL